MGKVTSLLDGARKVYREALEDARARPTPETWAKLLAAGKALSLAQEPKARGGRRGRRGANTTIQELEAEPRPESELQMMEHFE